MSGATNLSKKSKVSERPATGAPLAADKDADLLSVNSKTKSAMSNLNEEDEWQAIQNFNVMLHYEEQKQTALRERSERDSLKKNSTDKSEKRTKEKLTIIIKLLEFKPLKKFKEFFYILNFDFILS